MKAYFFNADLYTRYDVDADRADEGYPLPIAEHWLGLAEAGFAAGVDAAVSWGNGKVYLFRRDQYLRYDVAADRVDDGFPAPIAGFWPGFEAAGFAQGIDDAVNWGNAKAYFFRGERYIRYDIAADAIDPGLPLPIAGNWPGLAEAGFGSGIDAVENWGNGKAYFFRGDAYLRYDMAADSVDPGYPLPVAENWPGLAQAAAGAPDAVVLWPHERPADAGPT